VKGVKSRAHQKITCKKVVFLVADEDLRNPAFKGDMQRFFTKLMKKWFLGAYSNINPYV